MAEDPAQVIFPLSSQWCGIYIHIPFCRTKCRYCDFLSFPNSTEEEMRCYAESLLWEMEIRIPEVGGRFKHFTLYIGGGTPTILSLELMNGILRKACKLIPNITEITVEANPFTVSQELVGMLEDNRVTRMSLGVQSLNPKVLRILGRSSDREDILKALAMAAHRRFRLSVDLIYGAPLQDKEGLLEDIGEVASFGPDHISAYSLTLEGDVPLQKEVENGKYRLLEEDEWVKQMFTVINRLKEFGYDQYEVSNFAKDGEYCLHNLIYWSNGSYLGLGLGGVSHIDGKRWGNTGELKRYLNRDLSPAWEEVLPPERKTAETAILMLRTRWGIPEHHPICRDVSLMKRLEDLCHRNLLNHTNGAFVIPERLLPVANEVLSRIVAAP